MIYAMKYYQHIEYLFWLEVSQLLFFSSLAFPPSLLCITFISLEAGELNIKLYNHIPNLTVDKQNRPTRSWSYANSLFQLIHPIYNSDIIEVTEAVLEFTARTFWHIEL